MFLWGLVFCELPVFLPHPSSILVCALPVFIVGRNIPLSAAGQQGGWMCVQACCHRCSGPWSSFGERSGTQRLHVAFQLKLASARQPAHQPTALLMPRLTYSRNSRKFLCRSQRFYSSCARQQYQKLVREEDRRRRWVGRRSISHTLGG